ncbi:ABC transporter permease [Roseibium marinum]|uniref:Peptide/nickel transport system permease protein n=1 Tax=Roseibium marinum TaxID=281252 RepID=A0A2S3UKI8_9HYPH|nr:ABC transporter permease [Roseibium marinum]POF28009.1 peptide/nickel transport system permease protein [Roseibium marinum]
MTLARTQTARAGFRLAFGGGPLPLYLGGAILLIWFALAVMAPLLAPYDPIFQDGTARLQPPNSVHWFGTDNFGRDILSRIVWGARIDLQIALFGVVFPFLIGTTLGSCAGYFGGWIDTVLMRIIDVVLAFPFLVLMMAIIVILKPGLSSFYVAMALVGWVSYARLVRAQILVIKSSDFVLAATSLGYSHSRIMFRHLLPNAILGSVVFSMSDAVLVLLNGAAISYLGLGVQPPTAEWGIMIAEGQSFITSAWWITTFPGIAIVTLAMGFSLLADGLGELLGVRE